MLLFVLLFSITMVGVKFANILVKNINETAMRISVLVSPIRYLFPRILFRYGRVYLLSWTSSLYLYISLIIADLNKHGTDMTTKPIPAKVKDEDYYQNKSANLFKSCTGLRFSGLQDYETFLEKYCSILSISGFLQANGELLLSEYAAADNAIYDCIVLFILW